MNIHGLINRVQPPAPWSEGDNIPWNEPEFSRRMLNEHLSQDHDAASRRYEIIDQQVDYIDRNLLHHQLTTILDLGCGPGLYTERLARLGYHCLGIDYSPASIEYASSTAQRESLACSYICQDIRQAEYPTRVGLVMMVYGEFNAFRPPDARLILGKAFQALEPGGWLILEPHPYAVVMELGEKPASWYSSTRGLFSDNPHIVLQENFWDVEAHAATTRFYVLDTQTSEISRYAHTLQAYTDEEYCALIAEHGFEALQILAGLSGENSPEGLMAITARKPAS